MLSIRKTADKDLFDYFPSSGIVQVDMKSKKHLFMCLGMSFPHKRPVEIGKHSISDETYGRKSMIYFWNIREEWGITREEFEDMVENFGFKVNRKYGRGIKPYNDYDATEVQVSYFKGWHWDE